MTHLYAGSESTVNGKLKKEMRAAARANRARDQRHKRTAHYDVIQSIGQVRRRSAQIDRATVRAPS